jgi:two-component system phosphate regulon sensor histidine kinase PhoR
LFLLTGLLFLAGSHFYLKASFNSSVFQVIKQEAAQSNQLLSDSLRAFDQEFSTRLKRQFVFGLAFLVVVALTVALYALQKIALPVREIAAMMRGAQARGFSERAAVHSNDEIKILADSFNEMSEQLKGRIDEVLLSKLRLEAVFFSMFDGVMVLDQEGTIRLMNNSLRNVLKIIDSPIGRRPLEVIRNIDIQEIVEYVLVHKTPVKFQEIQVHLPEEKTFIIYAAPIIREAKSDGVVVVLHDVTDNKKLEKIRQDFVANASHELRTPVSTIKGYAETLLSGALEDKENARDFVEIIHNDANRLERLINDLLDLAKIESGKMKISLAPCDLLVVIDRAVKSFSKVVKDSGLTLSQSVPPQLPVVLADETGITQVLWNLLENAIKYNKPGGSIHISAKANGEFVELEVSDTGIGIPAEDIPRIFERFYRVDKARSQQLGGTGLGLAIVKHLIQAHHGEVSVNSELGSGSAFRFTLRKA